MKTGGSLPAPARSMRRICSHVAGTGTAMAAPAASRNLKPRAASAPNPVTGKSVTNDVERYEFWHAGKLVTLTLAAPQGSDNVDPWKLVTDSFTWTR